MKDWANRLDDILQLNGRELLTHAVKISHKKAMDKSAKEYDKFKNQLKEIDRKESLKELEEDIKKLKDNK